MRFVLSGLLRGPVGVAIYMQILFKEKVCVCVCVWEWEKGGTYGLSRLLNTKFCALHGGPFDTIFTVPFFPFRMYINVVKIFVSNCTLNLPFRTICLNETTLKLTL